MSSTQWLQLHERVKRQDAKIINHAIVPIDQLPEEVAQGRNKNFRIHGNILQGSFRKKAETETY